MSDKINIISPSDSFIASEVQREIDKITRRLKRALQYAGEMGVNKARDPNLAKTFKDQTGNLRSSIGYAVVAQGEGAVSDFSPVLNGDGAEGKAYAKEVAEATNVPFTLAVVAGKDYASYVAAKGYDVLDSAEKTSRKSFVQVMKK